MFRMQRIHHPAEVARTTSVLATTSAPHLHTPHARATLQIAHARERSDSNYGEPEPPAGRRSPHPSPSPPVPKEHP